MYCTYINLIKSFSFHLKVQVRVLIAPISRVISSSNKDSFLVKFQAVFGSYVMLDHHWKQDCNFLYSSSSYDMIGHHLKWPRNWVLLTLRFHKTVKSGFLQLLRKKRPPKNVNSPILSTTLYAGLKPCFARVNELKWLYSM